MSDDYQAKYEKLVLDYAKLATAYGELLARLSPPLPVYPQVPALPYQPYPRLIPCSTSGTPLPPNATTTVVTQPTGTWIMAGGSGKPGSMGIQYIKVAEEYCASCNVPLPGNCYAATGRPGLFCSSACMAVADSTAQGAR